MQPRISMITLGVNDFKAAVEFYQQGLGLPRREPLSDDIAFFDLNGTWLGLYPWDKLAEDAIVSPKGTGFRGVTLAHNLKSKEEVDAVMAQALSAGATLVKEAQEVFWGGYSGYFSDPDGHLWEIAWNPFSWIGPEYMDSTIQTGEQRYRHLFEHAPICFFVIDLTVNPPTILEVNQRAELIYGYSAFEMVGMSVFQLIPEEAVPIVQTTMQRLRLGQNVTTDTISQRRDGTRFPVSVIAALDPTDDGRMIVTVQDISTKQERRSEAETIAAERLRIAHEIHDGVAQSLAGLRFKLALWSHRAEAAPPGMSAALDELLAVLKTAIIDLRRSIFALRPLDLETLGFVPALTQLVDDCGDQGQLAARLELSGTLDALPAVYELPLFRIIQEGLNNIGQHARANSVLVRLAVDETGGVMALVWDDGCGFDPYQLSPVERDGHFGLRQMRERIVDQGGTLDIRSAVDQGTELVITLPPVTREANDVAD